ncbi:MAG: phosphoadenosine phosphosulfate reductase family protein [Thermoleophilia bacterium]|nr:phosphoadenosine phosphosulfate reductase family protein [Thermoleophilia bacterium]
MEREDTGNWTLEQKEEKSIDVLKNALERFDGRIATTFTGGKDSLTVLHLLKRVGDGKVKVPVLNLDTTVKFRKVIEFRDHMAREWDLDLVIATNHEGLKKINIAVDHEECCLVMKAQAIDMAMEKHEWKALVTGVRWDEQPARITEEYFSERPGHTRVQPILHFSELDIWSYIDKYQLPYCELYDQGYRSLGCEPCTVKSVRPRGDGPEREGRAQEKEQIMAQLRDLGYF